MDLCVATHLFSEGAGYSHKLLCCGCVRVLACTVLCYLGVRGRRITGGNVGGGEGALLFPHSGYPECPEYPFPGAQLYVVDLRVGLTRPLSSSLEGVSRVRKRL